MVLANEGGVVWLVLFLFQIYSKCQQRKGSPAGIIDRRSAPRLPAGLLWQMSSELVSIGSRWDVVYVPVCAEANLDTRFPFKEILVVGTDELK